MYLVVCTLEYVLYSLSLSLSEDVCERLSGGAQERLITIEKRQLAVERVARCAPLCATCHSRSLWMALSGMACQWLATGSGFQWLQFNAHTHTRFFCTFKLCIWPWCRTSLPSECFPAAERRCLLIERLFAIFKWSCRIWFVCVCLFTQNSLNLFITKLSAPIAILQRRPRQNAVYLAVYPRTIHPAVYLAAYPVVCTAIDLLTTVAVSAVSEWLRFRCRNCRLKLLSDQRSPRIQRF